MKLKKNNPIRIAIDSTAGSGSTSLAVKLASHYKLRYLDTGKVYRWCALQVIKKKPKNKIKFLRKRIKSLNLKDLKNKRLIDDKVAQVTSKISSNVGLRKIVFNFQKRIAYNIPKGYKGSVLNGRDITHNIIPDATFKFYVTASIFERSRRRYNELKNSEAERLANIERIKSGEKPTDILSKDKKGKYTKVKDELFSIV